MQPRLIHATAIAMGGYAALIRGPSGAGKSDLALRCLGVAASTLLPQRTLLVADDQVLLTLNNDHLTATAPAQIKGKLEVRGLGIVEVDTCKDARLALVVDLVAAALIERMPEPDHCEIDGIVLPRLTLYSFEASAALKLLMCLQATRARYS